jgi:NitT/TauT family transport system ATP-binding protein
MTPSIAALSAVEVDYAKRGCALGPVDLDLRSGEIVALVGPSGCGKSTALRLLAGLEQPTRGTVTRATGKGETAVVFQAPTLAPWLTAQANVALPLALAGERRAIAMATAEQALARVGLGDALNARPAQLSGGMAMRASLARALVTRPRLLLLDEPFAALDEITRRVLADDVLALAADLAPAMVFVTHNVEEAVYMAGRVVVMTPGPGLIAGEVTVQGPIVRPPGFRVTEGFRQSVEAVSTLLAQAGARAA